MARRIPRKKTHKTELKSISVHQVNSHLVHEHAGIYSGNLQRKVNVDIFRPTQQTGPLSVLLLNDGQDAKILKLEKTLTERYANPELPNLIVVGIHAGDRLQEYGTAGIPDYMGRGNRATHHLSFVLSELLPFLEKRYDVKTDHMAYAGFSLGGLSALDAVWLHPDRFSMAGVFSGSFWWRDTPVNGVYHDSDRIMHRRIAEGPHQPGLSFWFQAGTNDETADRNNNGIIDAIDDTLDLIKTLKDVGYNDQDIHYLEVEGGEHNFHTWSEVFPEFLAWAFPPVAVLQD